MNAFATRRLFPVALLAASVAAISGCASVDAPSMLTSNSSWLGVKVRSAVAPYDIESISVRNPKNSRHTLWTKHELLAQSLPIASGCVHESCWEVRAVPSLAQELRRAIPEKCSAGEPTYLSCGLPAWERQFRQLDQAQSYLLHGHSRAWFAKLYLLPHGDRFEGNFRASRTSKIELSFVFDYPTIKPNRHVSRHRMDRYIQSVVAMFAYELQHVAFAAGLSHGPRRSDRIAHVVKNEANSQCWMHAVNAMVISGNNVYLSIPLVTSRFVEPLRKNSEQIMGFSSAAVTGPLFADHGLSTYLLDRKPLRAGGTNILVNGQDAPGLQDILKFCRAFTGYSGNVIDQPMPRDLIALQPPGPLSTTRLLR